MIRDEIASKDKGDLRARFETLLLENQGIVFKVVHSYCSHINDRDDLIQEICWQLWRAFPSYDPTRKFSTWMYRVALNVAISNLRQRTRRNRGELSLEEAALPELIAPGTVEVDERIAFLNRYISLLDPLNRALLLLYLEERSYREIGEVLGISESNVATKISRLKQRIRQEMTEESEKNDERK